MLPPPRYLFTLRRPNSEVTHGTKELV